MQSHVTYTTLANTNNYGSADKTGLPVTIYAEKQMQHLFDIHSESLALVWLLPSEAQVDRLRVDRGEAGW